MTTKHNINSLTIARCLFSQCITPGSVVLDATAGRGRDTLFLAQLVGPSGKVWALDIQPDAIKATRELLVTNHLTDRVTLQLTGHENLGTVLPGPLNGAMFNLGYLPGGNKALITKPDTTVRALQQVVEKLVPGGLITIVLYTGHPGGLAESTRVEEFVEQLPQAHFDVLKFTYPNRGGTAPYLVAVQKKVLEE